MSRRRHATPTFAPMLATSATSLPEGGDWVVEPKYDGVRVIASIDGPSIGLITRNGRDKIVQFPEVREALEALIKERAERGALVMDGEVVSAADSDAHGRFEGIQGRIHLGSAADAARAAGQSPARFIAFDLLVDGDEVLVDRSWRDRRARLERVLSRLPRDARDVLFLSTVARTPAEARRLLAKMQAAGAEGVMAKDASAPYHPGVRTTSWRKVKLEHQQEFVIGGYTLPRAGAAAREDVGALLVGHHDDEGRLVYAGRVGTGFTRASARAVARRLAAEHRATSPFARASSADADLAALDVLAARGEVRWVRPVLVAEVRFNEWTSAGRLRQPVFLGLRDDKPAKDVRREASPGARERSARANGTIAAKKSKARGRRGASSGGPPGGGSGDVTKQLRDIAAAGGNGVLRVPASDGGTCAIPVTNLGKPLLPALTGKGHITKGDLLAYYATIAPVLLPAVADRPLVLRRFPKGLAGQAFYQQHAPAKVPEGVRVEEIADDDGGAVARRFVGGDLPTLLHLVQLGAISVDPWHGRFRDDDPAVATVDYSIIDLDPGDDAPFTRVVKVARVVKEELDALGLASIPKTSGASGLHVVVPLVPDTPAEAARLLAELVATRVAARMPAEATVTRAVARRKRDAVYVDYLQNIRGKSVAAVYSVRARAGATVSTPLEWKEVTARLDPTRFTIATVPKRVAKVGDLWAAAFAKPNDLAKLPVLR